MTITFVQNPGRCICDSLLKAQRDNDCKTNTIKNIKKRIRCKK